MINSDLFGSDKHYDVIIVGGGIVGMTLALILANSSLDIALVEATTLLAKQSPAGQRTLALAYSSRFIFEWIGVWDSLLESACPIQKIHVSDQGNFSSLSISSEEEKLPALGYVLPAQNIDSVLSAFVIKNKNITLIQSASFVSYAYQQHAVNVCITQAGQAFFLKGRLLVGADGQHSAIRKFLNLKSTVKDYQQTAVICNVALKRSHAGIAYERFTDEGPLAILPLLGQQGAVIWTMKNRTAERLLASSPANFRDQLQRSIGYRLGKIQDCSPAVGIGLELVTVLEQVFPGIVLLGNAAHNLHPVAGQGLNLALRDTAALAESIIYADRKGQPLGDLTVLKKYLSHRQNDQRQIIRLTDSLVGLFSNSLLPIVLARNIGMHILDQCIPLKKIFTKKALGRGSKPPRLVCGLGPVLIDEHLKKK
jgi:2-octaprenyl-6-methoxyphenol hydroxylase